MSYTMIDGPPPKKSHVSYSKLSIERLADAFAEEEGRRLGRVFALFMNTDTRRVLQAFLKALQTPDSRWSDCDLWGATFVVDDRIPVACMLLGCMTGDGPRLDDFRKALDFFTTGAPLDREKGAPPAATWSSILALF